VLTGTPLDLTPFGSVLTAVGLLYWTVAIAAMWWALRGERPWRQKAWRALPVVLVFGFMPARMVWDGLLGTKIFLTVNEQFEHLCYEQAYERIGARPQMLNELVVTPEKGPSGAYGFDLFFGSSRPRTWGSVPVVAATAAGAEGAVELRYTYLPQKYEELGRETVIHGVKIEVRDLSDGSVLAERLNFLWGNDFNRGAECLGASWYHDNQAFVERVIGPQSKEFRVAEGHGRRQQQFTKASLVRSEPVDKELRDSSDAEALPPGSKYDYNNRTIHLQDGEFKMLGYGNAEPIPIVATVSQGDRILFVLLPQGFLRNRPARQLLIHQRTRSGEELSNTFVQVPPGVHWQDGWGFDKEDVNVAAGKLTFSMYGEKVRSSSAPAHDNRGRYRRRYVFEAALPDLGAW